MSSVLYPEDSLFNRSSLSGAGQFDPTLGIPFESYARKAIENRLKSLYKEEKEYRSHEELSLDKPHDIASHEETPKDYIPSSGVDPARQMHRNEVTNALKEEVSSLGERQQKIVLAVSLGKSFQEIADELGVSKQAVHQCAQSAWEQMREGMESRGYKPRMQFMPAVKGPTLERERGEIAGRSLISTPQYYAGTPSSDPFEGFFSILGKLFSKLNNLGRRS